ncbi:hypothetical protein TVAG_353530 [Trichomonas vaginalis G3]|uniref:Uncharacterized protein n=1 Tax=Trichomonas vaginalis (strain ATCC PRA-98 / G3) TaxID=412133 RepID=A2EN75_TRIV3|nr:hypothetical protein TVAGG3_0546290 [Trichomonas vaginalis G3]EAY05912.1 hypothetical protein TVAG_353530 [Trichomonas vaginalis G3]KAI5520204.1 hypothetical protein TVAGG3_0546290 [Trichomonas vaginalis G3]|eukprot:XP_001318135.1 hypothetical protein [Trichomonas vaginalis G3]
MTQPSLIVLAVKRAMEKGKATYDKQIGSYSTFFVNSKLETTECPKENSNELLDFYIDDCKSVLPSKLSADEASKIRSTLEIIQITSALDDGSCVGTSVVQSYNNENGKLYTFLYSFTPKNSEIIAQTLNSEFSIRMAERIFVSRRSKIILKIWKREWEEYQKIPAVISQDTVVQTLSIAFAPFVYGVFSGPSQVIDDLKAQAKATTQTTVKDYHRIIYNPMKKMEVLVTDPEILKIIPTRWFKTSGSSIVYPVDYKFDQ